MNPTACLFATADENDRQRAISAGKSLLGREVILDAPDADFTRLVAARRASLVTPRMVGEQLVRYAGMSLARRIAPSPERRERIADE